MSSPSRGQSVSAEAEENRMRLSLDLTPNPTSATHPLPPLPPPANIAPRPPHQSPYTSATILQDYHSHLSLLPTLPQSEIIVLLTPVVIPVTNDPSDILDPHEPLGRAISERHAKIRHVPYTNRNSITSTHVGFIKRASVLVMVISDLNLLYSPPRSEEEVSEPEEREEEILQVRFAAIARAVFQAYGDRERPRERPFILIVTCPLNENTRKILQINFGTILCSKGYSKPALESTAAVMFAEPGTFASTIRAGNQDGRPDYGPDSGGPPQPGQPSNILTVQITGPHDSVRSPSSSQSATTQATPNPPTRTSSAALSQPPVRYTWIPEQWNEREGLTSLHSLWNQTMDARFRIDRPAQLSSLLNRTGYARHYAIRYPTTKSTTPGSPVRNEPASGEIIGFVATYLTYIDQEGEKLLGSIAIILVAPAWQNKGIGSTLHNFALTQLTDTMGVRRLQLGSLWPRLLFGPLCGPPRDSGAVANRPETEDRVIEWFRKHGWTIVSPPPFAPIRNELIAPGQGKFVHDLLLPFTSWKPISTPMSPLPPPRRNSLSPKSKKQKTGVSTLESERAEKIRIMKSQITFRSCTQADMASVLMLVDEAADVEGDNLGWYDQYSRLSNEIYVKDIIVATTTAPSASSSAILKNGNGQVGKKHGLGIGIGGVERTRLVGCAITYTPSGGNPVGGDLPWAGMGGVGIGPDVGGVCCVCVSATVDRESLMIGLLDACAQHLRIQGMKSLFLDTVRNHLEWFEELGFVEWARYRDIWRDVESDSDSENDQDMDA